MATKVDLSKATPYLKASIMGPSGSGKSSLAGSAPKVLILQSETQGKDPALMRARSLRRGDPVIVHMESLQDYRDAVKALRGDRSKPFVWHQTTMDSNHRPIGSQELFTLSEWPETVAIDSISDACELIMESIRRESPQAGTDGLPIFSQRHWNELARRAKELIRAFRDLEMNVLFLALSDDRTIETSDGSTARVIAPQLPMRKLPAVLMQAVNLAGFMQRRPARDANGEPKRDAEGNVLMEVIVVTNAPSYVQVKPCAPFGDREEPDFTLWVERWRKHVNQGAKAALEEEGELPSFGEKSDQDAESRGEKGGA